MRKGFAHPIFLEGPNSGNYTRENPSRLGKLLSEFGIRETDEVADENLTLPEYLRYIGEIPDCPKKTAFYESCLERGYKYVGDVLEAIRKKDKRLDKKGLHKFLLEGSASEIEQDALDAFHSRKKRR